MGVALEQNRRSVKNLLVDTKAQFRLALSFLVFLCGSVAIILYLFITTSNFLEQQTMAGSPEVLSVVGELKMKILMVSTGGVIILGMLCVALWAFASHRIFGPVVQIHQQIDRFIQGNYGQKIKLRRFDEFQETADKLNELGEKLNTTLSR